MFYYVLHRSIYVNFFIPNMKPSNILDVYATNESCNDKDIVYLDWRIITQHFIGPISVLFPIFIYYVASEGLFNRSILLRFITVILPFSYSAEKHFFCFIRVGYQAIDFSPN